MQHDLGRRGANSASPLRAPRGEAQESIWARPKNRIATICQRQGSSGNALIDAEVAKKHAAMLSCDKYGLCFISHTVLLRFWA